MWYKHSHSEYFTILSGLGLVGALFYLIFISWLLRFFKQKTESGEPQTKVLGVTGLALIVCYLDFSSAELFLSSPLGAPAFYLLLSMLLYFSKNTEIKDSKSDPSNSRLLK